MATENVVFLARRWVSCSPMPALTSVEVYRGRILEAADGEWVFSAYTGQSGVVGLISVRSTAAGPRRSGRRSGP